MLVLVMVGYLRPRRDCLYLSLEGKQYPQGRAECHTTGTHCRGKEVLGTRSPSTGRKRPLHIVHGCRLSARGGADAAQEAVPTQTQERKR